MIAIICLDDQDGMMFNRRRQSRDREVVSRILNLCEGSRLWMNPCSEPLFHEEMTQNIHVDEQFLLRAGEGEYCFVESVGLKEMEERLEKIIIFRWNRRYPADLRLDLCLQDWKKTEEEEFAGHSHEKITKEVYER